LGLFGLWASALAVADPNAEPKLCKNYPAQAPHDCAGVARQADAQGNVYVCTYCADAKPKPKQEPNDATKP